LAINNLLSNIFSKKNYYCHYGAGNVEDCGSATPRLAVQIYKSIQLPMKHSHIMILIYINYSLPIHYFEETGIGNEMCTSNFFPFLSMMPVNTWKIVD
jgi:hypothetical protein